MIDLTKASISDLRLVTVSSACFFGIVLMLIILFNAKKNDRLNMFGDRVFFVMVCTTLLLCALELATVAVDGRLFPGNTVIARILNTALFFFGQLPQLLWLVFVDYRIYGDKNKALRYAVIPAAVTGSLMLASLFNLRFDIYFSISPENIYSRTLFLYITFAVSYSYLIYALVKLIIYRKRLKKHMIFPFMAFLIPPLLGTVLQIVFYGLSLSWTSVSIGLLIVYLNIQNETSAIDALTGLYSRLQLDSYLKKACSRKDCGSLAGIMIDVDDFKKINDTFGHVAGDDALFSLGKIISSSTGSDDFTSRYAGDEFIILSKVSSTEEVDALINKIRNNTEKFNKENSRPYKLSFSIGYTMFDRKNDSSDKFLKRMDDAMYKEKNHKKQIPGKSAE